MTGTAISLVVTNIVFSIRIQFPYEDGHVTWLV